jgi:two-component system, sensor histidine kinase and response regulator
MAGDRQLYQRVLELLAVNLEEAMARFADAVASDDPAAAKSVVHGIRGMAADAGAAELAGRAGQLERMLRDADIDAEQLHLFRALLEQTIDVLKRTLSVQDISTTS